MKIFVAGGTGAVGRPLIAELPAKGHAVVALTRSPEEAKVLVDRPGYTLRTRRLPPLQQQNKPILGFI